MRFTFRARATALAAASLASASALVAQPGGVASSCNIDPNSPKELALITSIGLTRAKSAASPEQRKAALMSVMKDLDTKPERFAKNPAGYNYTVSQVLGMWAIEPGTPLVTTRGVLGYVSNPGGQIDIVATLDSTYKVISTAAPECAKEINGERQGDAWLAFTRRALDASNAGQFDTAGYYASRSLQLSGASPYPHYVMANVANNKGDKKAAVAHWKATIAAAGTDTSYADLKNTSMYYVAATQLEQATTASGADKQQAAREAAQGFTAMLAANPESVDASVFLSNIVDAMTLAGDTAQITTVYAPLLASPARYNDFALAMAGVIATRANKNDDAITLFRAATERNPYSRDALRNLAATLYGKNQHKDIFAPAMRLVEIDPNNYEAWMLPAYASQGLAQASKTPAEKKMWNDSTLKYQGIADKLPVKVDVTNFERSAKGATLQLTFDQVATAPGNYDVTVEFIDNSGKTIATDTQKVSATKGKQATATFKVEGAGITAYRYKPVK